jgi:hypothetical protein
MTDDVSALVAVETSRDGKRVVGWVSTCLLIDAQPSVIAL